MKYENAGAVAVVNAKSEQCVRTNGQDGAGQKGAMLAVSCRAAREHTRGFRPETNKSSTRGRVYIICTYVDSSLQAPKKTGESGATEVSYVRSTISGVRKDSLGDGGWIHAGRSTSFVSTHPTRAPSCAAASVRLRVVIMLLLRGAPAGSAGGW